MNRVRPKATEEGGPRSALMVYSSASQSPMNGSTKSRTRIKERTAGGSHQRQADRNFELAGVTTIFHSSFVIFHSNSLSLWRGLGEGLARTEQTYPSIVFFLYASHPHP